MQSTASSLLDATEISFERFPLWQGVRRKPGNQQFFPFKLKMHERGFICQRSSPDVQKKIVAAYKGPDYSMPTKPPGASPWANWLGELYRTFIKQHSPSLKGKTVIEIGAGSLYMAEHFTGEDGVSQYVIVDPSLGGTASRPHIRIIADYFNEQVNLDGVDPDLLVSLNCLEHVEDPFGFLVKVNRTMRSKDARMVLIFPDIETQFRMGDINALCFEHLNYFSAASATRLIEQAGLEVVTLEQKLDTLFYVLKRRGEPLIDLPDNGERDDELFATAAAKFKSGLKHAIDMIKDAQRQGKTVACHGACNGMNTLFALGDISPDHILIFDGDESKAGLFVPSCPVPILPATSPRYREADLVIVTAMTFYDQIRTFVESQHGFPPERIVPMYPPLSPTSHR